MASKAVIDAVTARVQANWTYVAVGDANGGSDTPKNGSPYLIIEYPVGDEEQISIGAPGANVFRETGALRFVLMVPSGKPLGPFLVWVDELRALFRGQSFGGVLTWSASPAVSDDRSDVGSYFKLAFAVPYRFDIIA